MQANRFTRSNMLQLIWDWLSDVEWHRVLPELVGKGLGFLAGFAASWFLLFRRKLRDLQRLQVGDTDDLIFQMHRLWPMPGGQGECVLLFRNVAPKTTLNDLYDNPAARELVKRLAEDTSLGNPLLKTHGVEGFELLNDALGHIAGLLAVSPYPRETWLIAMTCEDRHVVRKQCVRCFLVRPEDLRRFSDWTWCCTKVRVEKPWHWYRVVALHCIAKIWLDEQERTHQHDATHDTSNDMPLVDKHLRHNRVQELSVGLNPDERPVGPPQAIAWATHLPKLQQLGLTLVLPEPSERQTQAS
jgi:hypothetical protein